MIRGLPALSTLAALVVVPSSVPGMPNAMHAAQQPGPVRPGVSVVRLTRPLHAAGPWRIYPFHAPGSCPTELCPPVARYTENGVTRRR